MSRKLIATIFRFLAVAILLFVLLLAGGIGETSFNSFGTFFKEIIAVFRDPTTQWLAVLCLVAYFVFFSILEQRSLPFSGQRRFCNTNFWLYLSLVFVLLRYAFGYKTIASSMQVPVLLVSIVFGISISIWAAGGFRFRHLTRDPRPQPLALMLGEGSPEFSLLKAERNYQRHIFWLLSLLVGLLTIVVLWHSQTMSSFQYHGITRWSGVWDNPNLCGLLMGVGMVLAVGLFVHSLKVKGQGSRFCVKYVGGSLFLSATMICGYGLFKTYSRGAWLGTVGGIIYLIASNVKATARSNNSAWGRAERQPTAAVVPIGPIFSCHSWVSRFYKNRHSLVILVIALFGLMFWQFHFSEARLAQRAFSAANINDFSWRNRAAAWEGAINMMRHRPFIGFGWGQAETIYGKKYCQTDAAAAIEMNDYFMLGISAGAPALICFLAYILLCFFRQKRESATLDFGYQTLDWLKTTCRAGTLVLLAGFWFDGGLFKLPTSVVFWMLIELSRIEPSSSRGNEAQNKLATSTSAGDESTSFKTSETRNILKGQSESSHVDCYMNNIKAERQLRPAALKLKSDIWLRRTTWILAIVALSETALHLVPPHFSVSENTLAIARRYLIQPKERADFEFLAAQPIWCGQKLQVLLDHVELANYNRQLINWQLDETNYQNYVLSPVIVSSTINSKLSTSFNWRRPLWEEFYPRIRHESSPEDAAQIVVHHLRQRVTISALPAPSRDIPTIWLRQITDETGFEIIYVAALRSVGVPALLDSNHHAEFWTGNQWQAAPSPSIIN